tara:strand:+ start:206 stop:646 length:441 start_codon:yes stop_codon:yes gene_type:complete
MKTLRELILRNNYKSVFNQIHKFYLEEYDNEKKQKFDINFYSAWNELPKLNKTKNPKDKLYLVYIDTGKKEELPIIDVCLLDEEADELFALDFIDWTDLIDLNIEKPKSMSEKDCLSHILWEITFWGFTNQEVAREREKIKKQTKE